MRSDFITHTSPSSADLEALKQVLHLRFYKYEYSLDPTAFLVEIPYADASDHNISNGPNLGY